MKVYFLFLLFVILYNKANILASPPRGGIGDGYIYPVKQQASKSKPKDTTTYYAKLLHPPMKRSSSPKKPKPEVFKVIIENRKIQKPPATKREQIFKVIHLPANQKPIGGGGKTVKILKIIHLKGDQKKRWSK